MPCKHSGEQRAITGTSVTDEVSKYIETGYPILQIYKVAQYDSITKSGVMFTDYINKFQKIKQEASGWPKWCKTDDDKRKYMQDYYDGEGTWLNTNNIEKNLGLRHLAKLMLNSIWGKFGQGTNLPHKTYVSDVTVFFDMMTGDNKEIKKD